MNALDGVDTYDILGGLSPTHKVDAEEYDAFMAAAMEDWRKEKARRMKICEEAARENGTGQIYR